MDPWNVGILPRRHKPENLDFFVVVIDDNVTSKEKIFLCSVTTPMTDAHHMKIVTNNTMLKFKSINFSEVL
jgi:hypothetical protein